MRIKSLYRRKAIAAIVIIAGLLVGFFGFMAVAQTPPNDADSPAAALIGAAVYSAEGTEVGTVAAVTVGEDGQIAEIRFSTSSPQGLGERIVAVRRGSFIALDGAVVLDLSAGEVDALPVQTVLRRGTSA